MRDEHYYLRAENTMLQAHVMGLQYELRQRDLRLAEQQRYIAQLEQQVEELKRQATADAEPPAGVPGFVKPNIPEHRRKPPGRQVGHAAALRPMPAKIDRHQTVPLPRDRAKKPICPHCRTPLTQRR